MPKTASHDKTMQVIAQETSLKLYSRLSLHEASLFLRCSENDVKSFVKAERLDCIQMANNIIYFFGYQLLEFLIQSTTHHLTDVNQAANIQERIIRISELERMAGISRTTIWRREQEGTFPRRVSLGGNRVGWKLSEVNQWINSRSWTR